MIRQNSMEACEGFLASIFIACILLTKSSEICISPVYELGVGDKDVDTINL